MGDMEMNKFIPIHFPSSNLQTSKTILIEKSKGMPIQITWEKKKKNLILNLLHNSIYFSLI